MSDRMKERTIEIVAKAFESFNNKKDLPSFFILYDWLLLKMEDRFGDLPFIVEKNLKVSPEVIKAASILRPNDLKLKYWILFANNHDQNKSTTSPEPSEVQSLEN